MPRASWFLLLPLFLLSCSEKSSEYEGKRPDQPDEAARWNLRLHLNDDGTIPPDALMQAKLHRDQMLAAQGEVDRGGITRGTWRWMGPGRTGGRIRAIVFHPTIATTIWVGGASGGIWKTTDGGQVWRPLDDFLASLAVTSLVINRANPNELFAATGEGFFNGDAVVGAGIFRTTDGGRTWVRLPATANANFLYVNRLAIDPNNPGTLLAATNTGIWRTTDSGANWNQQTVVRALDVKFHPTSSMRAVAGQTPATLNNGQALWSNDGGVTWTPAAGLPPMANVGRIELYYTFYPGQPFQDVVHASVESRVGTTSGTHGVYRSTDNGQNYAPRVTGIPYLGNQGWYDNTLWVDPNNVAIIVFGGVDLWRTLSGGTTPPTKISDWTKVSLSVHADHHAIVAEPGSNVRLWFGNDGGLYRTNNILTVTDVSGWLDMNNALGVTQFYGGGIGQAGVVIGGTQDNHTVRHQGNTESWARIGVKFGGVFSFTGDGGRCAGDPRSAQYFYAEHQFARPYRSSDGGLTAIPIVNNLADAGAPGTTNFVAPLVLDPNDSQQLYVGCARLWVSFNARNAATWTAIKPSVASHISAVAVAPSNSRIVWVGHNDGRIFMTVNAPPPGPPAWVRVDNNIPGPHARVCTDLLIDPMNPNRVYATFGGFAANNVWRTTDGGANWVQITGGGGGQLPAIPVFSIELHRQAPGWLYAGTDLGVFISTDDGATWAVPTDGPANVPVYDLLWKGNRTLISVTHGRGMYQADAGPPPVPPGRSARASVSTAGVQAGSDCDNPSISTDGRFVAFHSSASNLVPGDGNGATDVFVHDRQARDVLLASTSSTGVLGNNSSSGASMSGDGRYVAFESGATNLVPNGRPGGDDVYVRDLLTAQTYRESVSSGQQLGDANSYRAAISADGRWVAFESVATNLVPGDGNGRADVFLRDRLSQTTVRVSLSNSGLEGMGASGLPAISADGRFVSFASDAPNLVEGDTNGVQDVFVRDVVAGNTFRVSVSSQGQEGNDRSGFSSVSADGRYVAFDSIATNLVPGDTNLWEDVFVHDRVTGETRRISFSVVEAQGDGPSTRPSISDDGQVVAFYTTASNLAPRDTNGRPDVLVADCVTGRITIASVSATGVQGNNESGTFGLDLSGNGRSAAFSSAASNLVPGDTNGFRDVIVHDRFPAVAARGVARIGATLTLDLDAPDEPNQFYVMAASLSSAPGIPLDTRTFPLTAGPFLIASLTMPAVFQGFTGNLDGAGHVEARIVIPAERSLGGTTIFVAAMTLRAGAPSGVWGISTPLAIRIFGP